MILLRKLLFPFAMLYGFITSIRNYLFDIGFLKSYAYPIPVIAVGNLSVGGTGKTPMIEYLIALLHKKYALATLSRGYKRQSVGFLFADLNTNAMTLGDEPYQMHQKFPDIMVAVDADRRNGIEQLLSKKNKPEIILLDDAFQHRKVKAGFYILLTAYGDLYADDWMLPTGNLRESPSGAKRADCIIVMKCPMNMTVEEQLEIEKKLKAEDHQKVYFAYIHYDTKVYSKKSSITTSELQNRDKLLLAGIAKPKPFFDHLQQENDSTLTFPDHHHFTQSDIDAIQKQATNKLIITTEKDYVRLKNHIPETQLFYLPIQTSFVGKADQFESAIFKYLGV